VDLLVIGKQVVEEQVGSDSSDLHETLLRFTDESLIYTYDQLLSEWAVNQQHGTDTIDELLVEDALWRSSIMDSEEDTARMGELLLNAGSDYLRELQQNLLVVGIEIVDIFMTDNRGAIVSMTRVAERYLYSNQTEFVQAFKNCSGHVYLRLTDATHMILSAPVTDTSNTLVGVLVWQIRVTPPAENHYFVETYSAEAAFVISVSVIGLVFLGIVMATLVKYRALPKIRALSVPMMLCMCVGGSLGMSSSLFYVGNPTNFICTMRHWTISLGIVMFIGGLVFKMGRIAKVFKHRSIREKAVLANKQMWMQYFFFCSIIGVTLIIFTAISPTTVHEDLNPFTHETDIFCVSALDGARNWVVITINAMLIFYGLYVIYETGKQKVEGRFDETKFLSIALYNVVGLTIFIAILEMTQIALHIVIIVKTMAVFCSVVISLGFSVLPRALSDVREISLSPTLTTSTKRAEILSRSSAAAVKRKSTTVMHNGKKRTIVRGDYLTKGVTAVKLVVGEKSSWSMPSRSMQSRTADSASHTKPATGSKSSLARPVSKSSPALSPKIAATSSPNASFILGSPCEPCEEKRGRSMTLRMKFHKDESVKCDHRKAGNGSNYRVKQESMKKTTASSSRLVEHGSFGRSPTSRTTLQVPSPQKSSSRSMSKRSRTNSMDQVSSSKDADVSAEEDTTEELVKNMTNLAAASFSATSQ
jgi:hypothetical protein